jgi:uncharacterized lipoprotein YddW (UPF0748 family)
VVRRYDVDGIHFDDYFYPYKERGTDGKEMDFPDDASWNKFGVATKLSRDDWRRQNVDTFIQHVYKSVKAVKPWVKFGVSPFGIWRPGHPAQIKGFDAYASLYADSRKWLQNGWVDYFTPQLYWAIEPKEQSFPALLDWWNQQNPKKRPIWPGLNTGKARTWGADEIVNQIRLAGKQRVSAGHVHWNMKSLLRNADLAAALERTVYAEPALVPAMAGKPPGKPRLSVTDAAQPGSVRVTWSPAAGDKPWRWVLQTRRGGSWTTETLAGTTKTFTGPLPDVITVSAIGRTGGASAAGAVQLKK